MYNIEYTYRSLRLCDVVVSDKTARFTDVTLFVKVN